MSLEDLAMEAGIKRATLVRALEGKTEPRPSTRRFIAEALGVDIEQLHEVEIAIESGTDPQTVLSPQGISDELRLEIQHLLSESSDDLVGKIVEIFQAERKEPIDVEASRDIVSTVRSVESLISEMHLRSREVFDGIPLSTARLICLRFGAISPGTFDALGAEAFLLEKADSYRELIAEFSDRDSDRQDAEVRQRVGVLLADGAIVEAESILSDHEQRLIMQEREVRRAATWLRAARATTRSERGQIASAAFDARTAAHHFASAAKIVSKRKSREYAQYKTLEATEWMTYGFESTRSDYLFKGIEIISSEVIPILKKSHDLVSIANAVAIEAEARVRISIWSKSVDGAELAAKLCRETIATLEDREPANREILCRLNTQLAFACFVIYERSNDPNDLSAANAAITLAEGLVGNTLATSHAFSVYNVKGNILWSLARKEDSETAIRGSIEAYDQALSLIDRRRFPLQFGIATNNQAEALRILAKVTGSIEYSNQAISKFEKALEFRTKSGRPAQWAMSKNNLGTALKNRGEISGNAREVLAAIDYFKDAQTVWVKARFPQQWAMAEGNIGATYLEASKLSLDEEWLGLARCHLESSIEAFESIGHVHFVEMHRDYLSETLALQTEKAK